LGAPSFAVWHHAYGGKGRDPLAHRRVRKEKTDVFARVSRFEGFSGDQVDEAVRVAREQFIPAAQQSGGFEGMYVLADRESGTALSIGFWESREAMQANEEQADRTRQDAARSGGGSVAGVERYEVVLSPEQT
jgi:heme-degrading monooxygenase HmoA